MSSVFVDGSDPIRRVQSPRAFLTAIVGAFAAVLVVATAGPAAAANATGRIILHVRQCPIGEPTLAIFTDCHSHLTPEGRAFRINGHASRTVSDQGNVKFDRLKAGTRRLTLTSTQQPNEFLHMRVFCSDRGTDDPAVELTVHTGTEAYLNVHLADGEYTLCDVSFVPESGQ
ncbi:MAG TPA: hypothetical protein VH482_08250 [Thermomicrobiales bacterium]